MFGKVDIQVNGERVTMDFSDELEIGDVSQDMIKVAAQMAFWGAVWAAAESEQQRADAAYRQWRADQTNMVLAADPKMAEWKVKAKIEETDTFVNLKAAIAQAANNVTLAKNICEAFKVKAHVLQSKGALKRADMYADGVHTPETPRDRPAKKVEREERVSAMRTMNRKKKAKAKPAAE